MFTNEIEWDETISTVMDETGQYEDIQLFIDDNEVFIRQWNEQLQAHDLITMSHNMFEELLLALNQGEGMYKVED